MNMAERDDVTAHVAAILNGFYLVRHYTRGSRSAIHRRARADAIAALGYACRRAFNTCEPEHFEAVLGAIIAGARPHEYDPPF